MLRPTSASPSPTRHHLPGILQRCPASGHQGRRQDRRPERPAYHQRADRSRSAYGLEKGKEDERILVFDLGGGTFDVSLLEIGKDDDGFSTIQVQATNGDNHLGGDDWDQKIIDWLVSEVKNKYGVDLSKDKIALQRLKEAAEQAKKELSSSTSTSISMQYLAMTPDGTPVHLDETLTRAHFEEMTSDLLGRCRTPFNNVLHDAGISVSDIDHVVLVGGSLVCPPSRNSSRSSPVVRKRTSP